MAKLKPERSTKTPESDFSEDETVRRFNELVRRMTGQPPTFSFETGQPFEGAPLSHAELKRRGYL